MHVVAVPARVVLALADIRKRAAVWGGAGAVVNGHPVLVDDGCIWVDGRRVSAWEAQRLCMEWPPVRGRTVVAEIFDDTI